MDKFNGIYRPGADGKRVLDGTQMVLKLEQNRNKTAKTPDLINRNAEK